MTRSSRYIDRYEYIVDYGEFSDTNNNTITCEKRQEQFHQLSTNAWALSINSAKTWTSKTRLIHKDKNKGNFIYRSLSINQKFKRMIKLRAEGETGNFFLLKKNVLEVVLAELMKNVKAESFSHEKRIFFFPKFHSQAKDTIKKGGYKCCPQKLDIAFIVKSTFCVLLG